MTTEEISKLSREDLIHNVKAAMSRQDSDMEKLFRQELKGRGAIPEPVKTEPVVPAKSELVENPNQLDSPILPVVKEPAKKRGGKTIEIEFPAGEFTVQSVMAICNLSQGKVNAEIISAIKSGDVIFVKNFSKGGRGKPQKIYCKAAKSIETKPVEIVEEPVAQTVAEPVATAIIT